jgi:hypothetical protein
VRIGKSARFAQRAAERTGAAWRKVTRDAGPGIDGYRAVDDGGDVTTAQIPRSIKKLLNGISTGVLEIPAVTAEEAGRIEAIIEQYASLRPQFADAVLVYLAHRESIEIIFTLDHRDFSGYRNARNKPFELIPA